MNLITLGIDEIKKDQFNEIKNMKRGNKPWGGLWTSPIESEYGWYNFVKGEHYREEYYLNKMTLITLKSDAKIYKIDSVEDFDLCPHIQERVQEQDPFFITSQDQNTIFNKFKKIDFEKLSEDYDGVWITVKAIVNLENRHQNFMGDLYGWDVETVLLFNLNCIESYA